MQYKSTVLYTITLINKIKLNISLKNKLFRLTYMVYIYAYSYKK